MKMTMTMPVVSENDNENENGNAHGIGARDLAETKWLGFTSLKVLAFMSSHGILCTTAATWRVKCGLISESLSQLTIHSMSYLKRN